MLSLFRTNQAQAGLLLLIYAFLLQLPTLLGGAVQQPEITGDGYLGNWLMSLTQDSRWLSLLLPVILITILAIQANLLAARHRFSRSVTQFPGLFLLLAWAVLPSFRWLSAYHAANIFLLFGIISLGRIYKRDERSVPLFNAGAWLGIAFLFRPEYLFFLPAFMVAVGVLHRPEVRSFLQLLTGFLLVCTFTSIAAYFFGFFPQLLHLQFSGLGFPSFSSFPLYDLIPFGLYFLFLLFLPLLYGAIVQLLNIEGKQGIKIIYWLQLFTILVVMLGGSFVSAEISVMLVPIGILLGLYLIEVESSTAEVVHLLLFAAALIASCAAWIPYS